MGENFVEATGLALDIARTGGTPILRRRAISRIGISGAADGEMARVAQPGRRGKALTEKVRCRRFVGRRIWAGGGPVVAAATLCHPTGSQSGQGVFPA